MKNRWLIALAAVGIHISIGSVYAYSVLKIPLFDHYGWADAVTMAFQIAIVFLGLSAAFMGHFVEKYGPRRAGTVAGICYGIGVIGSGIACWFAGSALQPTMDTKISDPKVQAAIVDLSNSLDEQLLNLQAEINTDTVQQDDKIIAQLSAEIEAFPQAQQALGDDISNPELTVKELIDLQIQHTELAKEAISKVEAGDTGALAAAKAQMKVTTEIKKLFVSSVVSPVAQSWQWLFLLFYGVFGGIGLGVGYISPVSTLVKWFPDRRGLATGLAIMGFGFASFVFAPLMNSLMASHNPAIMFLILGSVYLILMLSAASYLAPPPKDWAPAGFKEKVASSKVSVKQDLSQLTANEAIKTSRFYYLWLMLFINVTCGIALISVASPMAQEMVGLSHGEAAAMVGLMGLFNGLGRIGWASISDFIGRSNTYLVFFILQIVAFLLLPSSPIISSAIIFQAVVFIILTCYGGGFASIPAFIGDIFGTKQLGAIHGYVLTAWAAAGIAGPSTANTVREWTGDYAITLKIFAGLFVCALIINLLMKVDMARLRRNLVSEEAASKAA